MKANNKRIVFGISLLLIGTFTLLITKDLINKDKNLVVKSNNIKENKNIMAVYVIQDNGEYKQVDDIPQSGYQLNTSKSTCSNGAIPGWDVKTSRFYADNLIKNGTSCYLYFDKYVPTASEIILSNLGTNIKTTTPDFSKIATSDEGVYSTSDGTYGGTTYYWRGAATTNHVIFANKCWRIVRINGDNTLRLIYNGSIQDNNTCFGNGANDDSIAVTSQAYNLTFNASYYVGWTYSSSQRPDLSINSSTGLTEGGTASNAKTQIESWYDSNLSSYATFIANGKFCNDRNIGQPATGDKGYTTIWSTNGTRFAYAGVDRLYNKYQPTFNCQTDDVYTLKAGAITADEVMYAGGNHDLTNNGYYLYNGQVYWTMTPFRWDGSSAVFHVNSTGILDFNSVANFYNLRPVINLKSDVTFSSGNGEQSTPYIVS